MKSAVQDEPLDDAPGGGATRILAYPDEVFQRVGGRRGETALERRIAGSLFPISTSPRASDIELSQARPRFMGCSLNFFGPSPTTTPPVPSLHASSNQSLPAFRYLNALDYNRLFPAGSDLLQGQKSRLLYLHHARRCVCGDYLAQVTELRKFAAPISHLAFPCPNRRRKAV